MKNMIAAASICFFVGNAALAQGTTPAPISPAPAPPQAGDRPTPPQPGIGGLPTAPQPQPGQEEKKYPGVQEPGSKEPGAKEAK